MNPNSTISRLSIFLIAFSFLAGPTAYPVVTSESSPKQQDPTLFSDRSHPYVPGRIVIRYTPKNEKAIPRGRGIRQKQTEVMEVLQNNFNLPADISWRAVHEKTIELLEQKNLTEAEFINSLTKKGKKKKKQVLSTAALNQYGISRALVVELPADSTNIPALLADLNDPEKTKNLPFTIEAFPDHLIQTSWMPNDSNFASQWGLHNIGQSNGRPDADIDAPEAWDVTRGEGSVIAIIDTGVEYTHPDLAANIWANPNEIPNNNIDDDQNGFIDDIRGWDFVLQGISSCAADEDCQGRDNDPLDRAGHGTHTAGIAGAVTNNAQGIAGIAPNAKIMPLRAGYRLSNDNSLLTSSDISPAILYAIQNGATVINMSFAGHGYPSYAPEIFLADQMGVSLVAAAGNESSNYAVYPASFQPVIGVAATDRMDQRASFSSYGSFVDITAPGVEIRSTYLNGGYTNLNGTSMAAPLAAGVVALIKSVHPDWTPAQVTNALRTTADRNSPYLGWHEYFGYGRLNALRAVQATSASNAQAILEYPSDGPISGIFQFQGTAVDDNFDHFTISIQHINNLQSDDLFCSSTVQGQHRTLCEPFDTRNEDLEGHVYLHLRVYDTDGNVAEAVRVIHIDNLPPNVWNDGTSTWPRLGTETSAGLGSPLKVIGDVNGDGVEDFAVGEPGKNGIFGDQAGWLYVLSGVDKSILWIIEGDYRFGRLGQSIGAFGDLNQDGHADILVGAPGWGDLQGKVYIFSGLDGTLLRSWAGPAFDHIGFGMAMGGAGDVDQDGTPDVIIAESDARRASLVFQVYSAYVYSGASGQLLHQFRNSTGHYFMVSAVGGGFDANQDGYADLVVTRANDWIDQTFQGRLDVFSGLDGSILWTRTGEAVQDLFGNTLAIDGDLDRDGQPDLIVSSLGYDAFGYQDTGKVYVLSASGGRIIKQLLPINSNSSEGMAFGLGLSAGRDMNCDGISDIAVGTPWLNKVEIFSGFSGDRLQTISGPYENAFFGYGLALVNNAQLAGDIVIGSPFWTAPGPNAYAGRVDSTASECMFEGCVGDLNNDQTVDFNDLSILLANYGLLGGDVLMGDINHNGSVDLSDLAILLSRYGSTC